MRRVRQRLSHLGYACAALLGLMFAPACGAEDDDPVIGSGTVSEQVTDAMFVERVTIELPFRATVYNGEPAVVRIRGEDNLISLIEVSETEGGQWEIIAPDVMFEQHEDIEIEIPYIEMVYISLRGEDIQLGDNPIEVWRKDE